MTFYFIFRKRGSNKALTAETNYFEKQFRRKEVQKDVVHDMQPTKCQ